MRSDSSPVKRSRGDAGVFAGLQGPGEVRGGQGGIRTHGRLSPTAVFKTADRAIQRRTSDPQTLAARTIQVLRGCRWFAEVPVGLSQFVPVRRVLFLMRSW